MKKISFNQQTYGSIFKLVKYLGHMVKESTVVEIEGVFQQYDAPEKVIISEKFFRDFKCKSCGACCSKPKFSLVYTVSDYMRMVAEPLDVKAEQENRNRLVNEMVEVPVIIKCGKLVCTKSCSLFSNHGKECSFLFEKDGKFLCGIHKIHPLHCVIPHIHIDINRKGSTRLLKRQYGRNWALGCKAVEGGFDYNKFINWDIPCLRRLLDNAEDLEMDTWLPEIVSYLVNHKEEFKERIPTAPIVIYDKARGIPRDYLVKDNDGRM